MMMPMMKMAKNPLMLIACTLLFSALAVLATQSSYAPEECCFSFITRPVPKKKVLSCKPTAELCSMKGVLFTMANGRVYCTNPSVGWVKKIMENVRTKRVYSGLQSSE